MLLLLLGLLLEPSTTGPVGLRLRKYRTRSVGLVVWSGTFRSSKYRLYLFDLRMVNVGPGILLLADGANQKRERQ